jgi:hypothetical protein
VSTLIDAGGKRRKRSPPSGAMARIPPVVAVPPVRYGARLSSDGETPMTDGPGPTCRSSAVGRVGPCSSSTRSRRDASYDLPTGREPRTHTTRSVKTTLHTGRRRPASARRGPGRRPGPPTRFRLPRRPSKPESGPLPLLTALSPVVFAVGAALMFRRPAYLFLALLSPVVVLSNHWLDRRRRRVSYGGQLAEYERRKAAITAEASRALAAVRAHRQRGFPDPAAILMTAAGPGTRLWERRRTDDDSLVLRVGTGEVPSGIWLEDPDVRTERSVGNCRVDTSTGPIGSCVARAWKLAVWSVSILVGMRSRLVTSHHTSNLSAGGTSRLSNSGTGIRVGHPSRHEVRRRWASPTTGCSSQKPIAGSRTRRPGRRSRGQPLSVCQSDPGRKRGKTAQMSAVFRALDVPVHDRDEYWRHVIAEHGGPIDCRLDGPPRADDELVIGSVGALQVADLAGVSPLSYQPGQTEAAPASGSADKRVRGCCYRQMQS